MTRAIDNNTFLKYLLASLNVEGLKQICKEFDIKGYSRLKKSELIDFILGSLSEEEIKTLIENKELEIVNNEIELAIRKIKGEERESIKSIKVVNEKEHEIELSFIGFNWETTSYLSINDENIDDPERDCDCRIGANMGFCSHFWVGFIISLKNDYFNLSEWNLTALPEDFEKKIEKVKISGDSKDMNIISEDSDNAILLKFNKGSVTIYEGEITEIVERQSEYQDNITTFYHISLKDVQLGPRVKKKTEYREEDIVELPSIKIRISEKLHSDNDFKIGMRLKLNGKLDKDNFWGYLIKNIRKVEII
jgi:hypothetical protein